MGRIVHTPHGEAAHAALWGVVDAAKATDPLALVTVVVPNAASGLQLRRGTAVPHLAMINVRTSPFGSLAHLLAGPELARRGLRPLTEVLHRAFVRAAVAQHPKALNGLGTHPATVDALGATLRELAGTADDVLGQLATRPWPARDVVAIERTRRVLAGDHYDTSTVVTIAAEQIRAGAAPLDQVGHVVLYLPVELQGPHLELCDALAAEGRLSVVLPEPSPLDGPADVRLVERCRTWFGPDAVEASGPAPGTEPVPAVVSVVYAPEPHDELRWIANDILQRAEAGQPLYGCAVVMRVTEPYRRIVVQTLEAAGIAHTGEAPRTLDGTTAGRFVLGACALANSDWHRDDVVNLLQSAPVRNPNGDRFLVPVTRWDRLTRRAGVVRGIDQWAERLAAFAREGSEDRAADVDRCTAFVTALHADLQPPERPTWAAWSTWMLRVVRRYLGRVGHLGQWPESEVVAYERVVAAIESLAAIDAAPGAPDLDSFVEALTHALAATAERIGTFGRGVFVGTTADIRGCAFDVVYVVGMAEGMYPPRGTENPLLRDADREACLPDAPRQHDRSRRERRMHLDAAATASEVVYSFPRGDVREQRSFLASPLVVEAARRLHGTLLSADDLVHLTEPWVVDIASFAAALGSGTLLSADEAATSALVAERVATPPLAHPIVNDDPQLRAGFTALAARATDDLTIYDGNVGPLEGLLPQRPLSPTSLEQLAQCPFRYFLAHVLDLREADRPEELDDIRANELGSLVHDVLDRFVTEAPRPASPGTPWTAADRDLLHRITQECFDAAEARGVTGRPVLWRIAQRKIRNFVALFLEHDDRLRAERGVVPMHSELAFGLDTGPTPVPGSIPAVTLDVGGGREVRFRGYIDRVDRAPDGSHLIVTDYKTGNVSRSNLKPGDDPVDAGRRLQLAVYAHAAQQLEPDARVGAYYWFLQDPASPRGWDASEFPVAARRLHDVARSMFDAVEAGAFPAVPGGEDWVPWTARDTWKHCIHCPYERVCPLERADDHERKVNDPAFAHLAALPIEPDDLVALRNELGVTP